MGEYKRDAKRFPPSSTPSPSLSPPSSSSSSSPSPSSFDPIQLLKQLRGGDGVNVNSASGNGGGMNSEDRSGMNVYRGEGDRSGNGDGEMGTEERRERREPREPRERRERERERAESGGHAVDATRVYDQQMYRGENVLSRNAHVYNEPQMYNSKAHDNLYSDNRGTTPIHSSTHPKSEASSKWNANNDPGMIALLQRQVAEKASENNKLLRALEDAHRTIALLREENKALEHALSLHSQAPLPPSFPLPSHPSELAILRDRVAYLESALESALATSGELGPDWNLGELELDPPTTTSYHPTLFSPLSTLSSPPLALPSPPLSSPPSSSPTHPSFHQFYPPTDYQHNPHPSSYTNGNPPTKLQTSKNGNGPTHSGKDSLDKRPPFSSTVSSHSSRYAKHSDTAKLQIPKAPPDVGKPIIRIDLSAEMSPKIPQPQPAIKKKNVYSNRPIVSIPNYPHT